MSRNVSHRNSGSTSFMSMIKTTNTDWKDKERRYNDKIKALKSDKRNLESLCKDSEKMYCAKIQEQKKEIQNMQTLFKQIWPLIKHKVKDPTVLLQQMNKGVEPVSSEEMAQLRRKNEELVKSHKHALQREKEMKQELAFERERRHKVETANR